MQEIVMNDVTLELVKTVFKNQVVLRLYEDGEPYATCTVALPGIPDGFVAIKDYSENTGVLNALLTAKVVAEPLYYIHSGHVQIPVCKLLI